MAEGEHLGTKVSDVAGADQNKVAEEANELVGEPRSMGVDRVRSPR